MIDTSKLLDELGYDYYVILEKAVKPPVVQEKFEDIIPNIKLSDDERCLKLAGKNLYLHQKQALDALCHGFNLVLKAGSGSGKTEAWFLFSAKKRVKTLAVYPTLALSNDQQERLIAYCSPLNMKIVPIDALRKTEYVKKLGVKNLRRLIAEADIVITNPAYLLNELKRIGFGKSSFLKEFLSGCGLVVLDEFDFYGPRSIALLLTMVRLIVEIINPKIQITIMTATLQDPKEVGDILSSINSRETVVVDGEPFHAENRMYLVLGKSVEKIWRLIYSQKELLREAGAGQDIMDCLRDFETFKKNFHKVVGVASAAGLSLPEIFEDPSEILKYYATDDALTLVFTSGISSAEEMAKRVMSKLNYSKAVATHHHLLLKAQRQEIEAAARRGEVRLIFTPRTLSQGIDIGTVKRVVHLGLPQNVREFRQREGRKGRRPDIDWTETIIIPISQWDRDLLSRGFETFKKWVELPLEKTIISRENLYSKLFRNLFALQSPILKKELKQDDIYLLRSLGLESDGSLTRSGKMAWLKMNFYEFAPPYGIKRWRVEEDGGLRNLEDISHVDLVEKFQLGSIDPSSDGVVVDVRLGGAKGRVVTSVVIDDLSEYKMRRHDALAPVLEEYEITKLKWGERPNIRSDFYTGRLHTSVNVVVHAPSNGFGLYTKFPNRVEWRVTSNKKQLITIGDKTYVSRIVKSIEVPAPTYGIYSDYTYGLSAEASPLDDPTLLKIGACLILIVLRRLYNISLDLLKHDVLILGDRKVVVFHESESACLLPEIDWRRLYSDVERYVPDGLDEVFLEQLDEQSYSSFVAQRLDWEVAKSYALKIIDYFSLKQSLRVKVGDKVLEVTKPSRALKALSLTVLPLVLREDIGAGLYSVAFFDGEGTHVFTGIMEFKRPSEEAEEALSKLLHLLNQGYKVIVYDFESLMKALEGCGLEGLKALLVGLLQSGKVVEVKHELWKKFEKDVPLEVLESSLGLQRSVWLTDLIVKAELEKRRRPSMHFIRSKPDKLRQLMERFLSEEARNIFIAWLVSQRI